MCTQLPSVYILCISSLPPFALLQWQTITRGTRDPRTPRHKPGIVEREKNILLMYALLCPLPLERPQPLPRKVPDKFLLQLELTLEKLLAQFNISREQADSLPFPHIPSRVRELEDEVRRLRVENESLRRQFVY